jgi:hypothetical protein
MIAQNPEMLKNERAQKLLQEAKAAGYDIKMPEAPWAREAKK